MKSKLLSELSKEELIIEVKSRKNYFTVMLFMVTIMLGCAIVLLYMKGFGVFTMLPIVFIAILLNLRNNHIEAKKELESRTK